ncbi:hypothetical protein G7Y89_g7379 [Cudoniella acicularis]|uniref:Uncharacterized protein n=1 Tax=Cudoniella acicularis TaxID=354080 RepID=A0A8H4W251_9HELO|nr:hypothetical protein G7Y89_g7379 [Cudoniella acicularis]
MFRRSSTLNKLVDPDDDDVSIHSTASSEHSDDHSYEVDRVLAEKKEGNQKYYLLLWEGYPEHRSSWEPRRNISHEVLEAWKERKSRELQGLDQPFDLAQFEALLQKVAAEKKERLRRRKAKRKHLGITVSDSEHEAKGAASDSSQEAMEMDDGPEDDPGLKASAKSLQKAKKRLVPRSRMQSRDDSESDAEPVSQKAQKMGGKQSNATRTSLNSDTRSISQASRRQRAASESSSDTPLANSRVQTKANPNVIADIINDRPRSSASESTGDLLSARDTLPASRGKGAIRGSAHKSVFARREPAKKRPTLLETSSDPTKESKHYKNWHIRRKAELAGRSLQDAAPDIAALGGLFKPSDPSNMQPLKPADLRKAPPPIPAQQVQSPGEISQDVGDEGSSNAKETEYIYVPTMARERIACFFFNLRAACSNGSSCRYLHTTDPTIPVAAPPPGYRTESHYHPEPVQNPAQEHISGQSDGDYSPTYDNDPFSSDERGPTRQPWETDREKSDTRPGPGTQNPHNPPPWQNTREKDQIGQSSDPEIISMPTKKLVPQVCFYWHSKGDCTKQSSCDFYHTNDKNLPVAKQPGSHFPTSTYDSNSTPIGDNTKRVYNDKTSPLAKQTASHPPPLDSNSTPIGDRTKSVKFAIDDPMDLVEEPGNMSPPRSGFNQSLTRQKHTSVYKWRCSRMDLPGGCHFGKDCWFSHDPHAPRDRQDELSKPAPKDYQRQEHSLNQPRYPHETSFEDFSSSSQNAPIAPKSHGQKTTCRFWLAGYCERGGRCAFLHAHQNEIRATHGQHSTGSTDPDIHLKSISNSATPTIIKRPLTEERTGKTEIQTEVQTEIQSEKETEKEAEKETMSPLTTEHNPDHSKLKRAKMSFEDYRRKAIIKSLGGRVKSFTFGNVRQQSIQLDTGDLAREAEQPWGKVFTSLSEIRFDQMCMVQDFKSQNDCVQRRTLWKGGFFPIEGDSEASNLVVTIAEEMRLKSSGLLFVMPEFVIITYPTKSEDWKFLRSLADDSNQAALQYLVFESNLKIAPCPRPANKERDALTLSHPYRETLVHKIHQLSVAHLLPHSEKHIKSCNFYFWFPSTARQTEMFMASWIHATHPEYRLYDSQKEGSWDFFLSSSKKEQGVVLIHESMATYLCKLPSLNKLLRSKVNNLAYWHISDSSSPYPLFPSSHELNDSNLGRITTTRLLPHGAVCFLTPSFVIAEPEKALELLRWFFGRAGDHGKLGSSSTTPGTWKLVCCYNFVDYLLDIAHSKATERLRFCEENNNKPSKDAEATNKGLGYETCNTRYELYKFFANLRHTLNLDKYSRAGVDYYSGIGNEAESPIIYADRYIDPDNERALVEWFAGWAMGKLDLFRRFFVIGTDSSSIDKVARIKEVSVSGNSLAIPKSVPTPTLDKDRIPPGFQYTTHVAESPASIQTQNARAIAARLSANRPVQSAQPAQHSGDPPTNHDTMDIGTQITELIQNESFKPSGAMGDSLDAQSHQNYDSSTKAMTTQRLPKLTTEYLNSATSLSVSKQGQVSAYQIDGAGDYTPISAGTDSSRTSRSGIQTGETGERYVPSSLRPSGTVRKEISIKPGYVPPEDKDVYQVRKVGNGVAQYSPTSNSSSRVASNAASPTAESDAMDLDGDDDGYSPTLTMDEGIVETVSPKVEMKWEEIAFEPTTVWYRRVEKRGDGWEHLIVENWEGAWANLGVKRV